MALNKIWKYGSTAAVGGALFGLMYKDSGSLITPIGNIPVPVAGGLISVGASMLSDMAHAWILPHLSDSKRLQAMESKLLTPAMGGVGFIALAYIANPYVLSDTKTTRNLFLLGAMSEILGQFAYEALIAPMLETQ